MTEWQNHRIPEGQGKSSIAPTFSKRGYKKRILISLFYNQVGKNKVFFSFNQFVKLLVCILHSGILWQTEKKMATSFSCGKNEEKDDV